MIRPCLGSFGQVYGSMILCKRDWRLQIVLKSHLKPLDQIKSNLARMDLVILNKKEFFGVQFNGSKSTFMNFKTPFMQFEFKILKTSIYLVDAEVGRN
jgi:hypothetical protein